MCGEHGRTEQHQGRQETHADGVARAVPTAAAGQAAAIYRPDRAAEQGPVNQQPPTDLAKSPVHLRSTSHVSRAAAESTFGGE